MWLVEIILDTCLRPIFVTYSNWPRKAERAMLFGATFHSGHNAHSIPVTARFCNLYLSVIYFFIIDSISGREGLPCRGNQNPYCW